MWIFYFLLWTAVRASVRASAEEPLYRKIGDEAVLTPDSVENPITYIRWKHGPNIAIQWYGDETISYKQFKDRGSLNISTGVMTITGLTPDLSGIYTSEINGKVNSETQLLVISPVPKPSISVSCERTYCVFTCSGNITDTEPVTYWWTAGEKRWNSTKQLRITKEEEEQWFICTLENPISSSSSEKVFNPIMKSDKTSRLTSPAIGVPLAVCSIIIIITIIIIIYLRYKNRKEPLTYEGWSTTLKPTTAAFWREKRNDKSVYSVTKDSMRSRVALLITNIEFTDEVMNRSGAEKDEENMEKLLTALGYEVVKYTNLTGKKIEEAVIKFSKHPKLRETDSVFVVIMSHGKRGAVLGVNYKKDQPNREQEFPIDDIYKHLDTKHCPELLNKPKIIIIQADKGEKGGAVLVRDDAQQSNQLLSAGDEDTEDYCLRRAHIEKDFICFLSSTPDIVSYRHPDKGSFLIQYIVDVLNTFACKDHIEELFTRVIQRFKEDFPSLTKKQIPTKDRCTLIKNFFLFPQMRVMLPAVRESSYRN